MKYITYFVTEYQSKLSAASNVLGIVGFVLGIWRYLREREVQAELKDRQAKLNETLARLGDLRRLATCFNKYSAAV